MDLSVSEIKSKGKTGRETEGTRYLLLPGPLRVKYEQLVGVGIQDRETSTVVVT